MNNQLIPETSFTLNTIIINPFKGDDIIEQFESCLDQLNNFEKKRTILKINCFINVNYIEEFIELKNIFQFENIDSAPISFIFQAPAFDFKVSFEITYTNDEIDFQVVCINNLKYLRISAIYGTIIIAAGLGNSPTSNSLYNNSLRVFEDMNSILKNENISYSEVIRQWNYIERIVDSTNNNQHYQIFNDVRSFFYYKDAFQQGYPAATGIGIKTGGVIIDFIALKKKEETSVIPIKSQIQTDAHQYSKDVLANIDLPISKIKTTPKFERAKVISLNNHALMFVSGTAAIKGEKSAAGISAANQTKMTLDNISNLYSDSNLLLHGLSRFTFSQSISYRVYIKNPNDAVAVKESFSKQIKKDVPVIYVIADICRTELLVEIEAIIELKKKDA